MLLIGLVIGATGVLTVKALGLRSVVVEAKPFDGIEEAVDARNHAIGPTDRQPTREHFEDRAPRGDPRPQRGRDHGQLVVVREQSAGRPFHSAPR